MAIQEADCIWHDEDHLTEEARQRLVDYVNQQPSRIFDDRYYTGFKDEPITIEAHKEAPMATPTTQNQEETELGFERTFGDATFECNLLGDYFTVEDLQPQPWQERLWEWAADLFKYLFRRWL